MQASMHMPRFDTQFKQSSKQPFSREMKASISNLKIEDETLDMPSTIAVAKKLAEMSVKNDVSGDVDD